MSPQQPTGGARASTETSLNVRRVVGALCLAALMLGTTGCFNAKIRTAAAPLPGGEKHSDTGVSLFWGMSNTTSDAIECPNGLSYAEAYWPWWGYFLVSPLTLGIVVPIRKVYICAAQPAAPAASAGPQIVIVQPAAAPVPPAAPTPNH